MGKMHEFTEREFYFFLIDSAIMHMMYADELHLSDKKQTYNHGIDVGYHAGAYDFILAHVRVHVENNNVL